MLPNLKIDKNILLQFEHYMRQKLDMWEDLEDLWKMSLYDHRAYKLLIIVSINKGKSKHDKILLNAFINTLKRYKSWSDIISYFKSNFEWEEQPNYFNFKYMNDTARMLIDFVYRKKYLLYYDLDMENYELKGYIEKAVNLEKPEYIIGIYELLNNKNIDKTFNITNIKEYPFSDKIKTISKLKKLHEYVIYGYDLDKVYKQVYDYLYKGEAKIHDTSRITQKRNRET